MNPVQHILIFLVRVYRWTLSPAKTFLFGSFAGCRYTPSCSAYALEALQKHGALAGSWLAVKRVCRCHPWSACGHDPVPGERSWERRRLAGVFQTQTKQTAGETPALPALPVDATQTIPAR